MSENSATATAAYEAFERSLLHGMTIHDYQNLLFAIIAIGLAVSAFIGLVLYVNRKAIARWFNRPTS